MKKLLKIGVPVVLLLVVVGVVVLYLSLNSIVRDRVEVGTQQSLNLPTDLDAASVSLFGSSASLDGLSIGNPSGFGEAAMINVGGIDVDASYSELLSDPIRVGSLTVESPTLRLERAGGSFNFKAAADGLPPSDSETPNVIIDTLTVTDTTVVIDAKLPGVEPLTLTVPSVVLSEVGTGEGNQNGAEIGRVVMSVVTEVVQKLLEDGDLPPELRPLLAGDFGAIVDEYKSLAEDQVRGLIDENVGNLQNELQDKLGNDLGKELGEGVGDEVKKGLGNLLGGRKDEE